MQSKAANRSSSRSICRQQHSKRRSAIVLSLCWLSNNVYKLIVGDYNLVQWIQLILTGIFIAISLKLCAKWRLVRHLVDYHGRDATYLPVVSLEQIYRLLGKHPFKKTTWLISGAKTSAKDFIIDVGMVSTGDDLTDDEIMLTQLKVALEYWRTH